MCRPFWHNRSKSDAERRRLAGAAPHSHDANDAIVTLLVVIDPHASPTKCVGQRVLLVEEIIERVE